MPLTSRRFALIAPNYHPLTCGVGDHSMRLGGELVRRGYGAAVFTHAPATPNPGEPALPAFGMPGNTPISVAKAIADRIIADGYSDAVIQYTARMWGTSRFGSPALALLAARLQQAGVTVTLIAHELFTPWRARPDLAVGAALLRMQFGALMRSCAHLFVTTETRKRFLAPMAAGLSPERNLHIMRIGPNVLPIARTPSPSGHRVGLFSTMAFGKRFDVVIDAFEAIMRAYPDAELLLIGDLGPATSDARRALDARIERSAARDRIHTTGKLALADIATVVASLDLYLFPMDTGANTRSGTLPVALGAGVPVVSIAGAETDAIFVDGENIVFARELTGPAFAEAALSVFGDSARSQRLTRGERDLYEQRLSWPRITDAFLAAISR